VKPTKEHRVRFLAYDLSLDIIRDMRPALVAIRRHSANLARHCNESLESVALNIAEGDGRYGGDRRKHFAAALGSLRDVNAAIDIATAAGVFELPPLAVERDRLGGMLWRSSAGEPGLRPSGHVSVRNSYVRCTYTRRRSGRESVRTMYVPIHGEVGFKIRDRVRRSGSGSEIGFGFGDRARVRRSGSGSEIGGELVRTAIEIGIAIGIGIGIGSGSASATAAAVVAMVLSGFRTLG
jgi:hypothetical protein